MRARFAPLLFALALVACHESHDLDAVSLGDAAMPSDVPAGDVVGPDGGGGASGSNGASGAGGRGGTNGGGEPVGGTTGGGPVDPALTCVGCQPAPGTYLGDLPPCCTASGRCGLDTAPGGFASCVERDAPGVADPTCADFVGVVTLQGCCRYDGTCGVMFNQTPVGCANDPALFTGTLAGPPPAPIPCGPVR